jgi:hypothetical protein
MEWSSAVAAKAKSFFRQCRSSALQRGETVVDAASMRAHVQGAVIGLALIANAEWPLRDMQPTSRAPWHAEIARTTVVTSCELVLTTLKRHPHL